MFNPNFDEKMTDVDIFVDSDRTTKGNVLDLRKGMLFRAFDLDGNIIEHENGAKQFLAKSNPYVDELGIPVIDVEPVTDDGK